jgi:type III secretion protein Q
MQQAARTHSQVLTGKLKTVHPPAVRLLALAFDARAQSLLQQAALDAQITPAVPGFGAAVYRLRMGSDAGPIEWLLSADADADPALSMAAAPQADERMRRLAAELLFGRVADQLQQWGVTGARCTGIEVSTSPSAAAQSSPVMQSLGWVRSQHGAQPAWTFTLAKMPDAVFHALKQQIAFAPNPGASPLQLALPGAVTLCTRTVSLRSLQALNIGDVLVTPCESGAAERSAVAHWGARQGRRLSMLCRLTNLSLTAQGVPQMADDTDTTAEPSAQDMGGSIDELDIPVRFEVETVAIPLADLQAIRPGYVIELATPLEAASIRLVAYGQTIGHAELVAVGDRLGARITRMVPRNERHTAH